MGIKFYMPKPVGNKKPRTKKQMYPWLTANGRSGAITFNRMAVEHFKLKQGSKFTFGYDDITGEWFLINVDTGSPQFTMLCDKNGTHYIVCIGMATNLVEWYNQQHNKGYEGTKKSVRFRLAIKEAQTENPDGTISAIPDTYAILGGDEIKRNK